MTNRFFISDTHFGHANILNFKRSDGSPVRSFDSVEEMDEEMIRRWNSVVHPKDSVYHLGDVVINRKALHNVSRLNGRKKLIAGNHDPFATEDYFKAGFEKVMGVHVFVDKFICSHIPLHPDSITKRFKVNVHGHTHTNKVMLPRGIDVRSGEILYSDKPDPRYFCVSVEQIDYTPISFDEIIARIS